MSLHSRSNRRRDWLAGLLPESLLILLVLAFLVAMLTSCATVDAMSTPAGVMKQESTPDGAAGLIKLLDGPTVDAALSGNITGALNGANTNALMTTGGNMLRALFGDRVSGLASTVSSTAGVKSSSAINLLSLAVPMVLSFLKNHVTRNGVDAGGLMSLLTGQSGFLQGKLDNRISQAAGLGDASGFLSSIASMVSLGTGTVAAAGAGAAAAASRAGGIAADAANAATGAAKTIARGTGEVAPEAAGTARNVGMGMSNNGARTIDVTFQRR